MYRIIFAVLILVSNILVVHAAQTKMVRHTETLTIDVSIKDPNIISLKNDKITDYLIRKNAIKGEISNKLGILSLKPTQLYYKKPFSMILFTELGYRYTAIVNPKDIPAQDIVLDNNNKVETQQIQEDSILRDSYKLIKAMINDDDFAGYSRQDYKGEVDENEHLHKDTYLVDKKYQGEAINGEVIVLETDTNNKEEIKEQNFYEPGVIAVSIDRFNIKANQTAKVYRVIKNG